MEAEGGGAGAREDPTPWTALASLGLFKLFNDWQSQGVQLPPELLMGPAMRTMAAQSSSHPEAVGGAAAPFAANAAGAPVPGKAAAKVVPSIGNGHRSYLIKHLHPPVIGHQPQAHRPLANQYSLFYTVHTSGVYILHCPPRLGGKKTVPVEHMRGKKNLKNEKNEKR